MEGAAPFGPLGPTPAHPTTASHDCVFGPLTHPPTFAVTSPRSGFGCLCTRAIHLRGGIGPLGPTPAHPHHRVPRLCIPAYAGGLSKGAYLSRGGGDKSGSGHDRASSGDCSPLPKVGVSRFKEVAPAERGPTERWGCKVQRSGCAAMRLGVRGGVRGGDRLLAPTEAQGFKVQGGGPGGAGPYRALGLQGSRKRVCGHEAWGQRRGQRWGQRWGQT
jgi:hypothetical protein